MAGRRTTEVIRISQFPPSADPSNMTREESVLCLPVTIRLRRVSHSPILHFPHSPFLPSPVLPFSPSPFLPFSPSSLTTARRILRSNSREVQLRAIRTESVRQRCVGGVVATMALRDAQLSWGTVNGCTDMAAWISSLCGTSLMLSSCPIRGQIGDHRSDLLEIRILIEEIVCPFHVASISVLRIRVVGKHTDR